MILLDLDLSTQPTPLPALPTIPVRYLEPPVDEAEVRQVMADLRIDYLQAKRHVQQRNYLRNHLR